MVRIWTVVLMAGLGMANGCAKAVESDWEKRAAERLREPDPSQLARIEAAQPEQARVNPLKERRLLVFWRCEGYIHTSIPWANAAMRAMADRTGAFEVDFADQYAVFEAANLARYDALLFNNTTHLVFPEESMQQAILEFIQSGKGVVGLHAATDNFYEWEAGAQMMGGQFCGHPWTADGTWAFRLNDPKHTLNQAFGGEGFRYQDEIYQYDPATWQGEAVLRLLVSLDFTDPATAARLTDPRFANYNDRYGSAEREVPVSWVRRLGEGRLFNTNFGHREETYTHAPIMRHLLDGIQYALGDLPADERPTAHQHVAQGDGATHQH
jgi:type 1 glutamine amidotransferase